MMLTTYRLGAPLTAAALSLLLAACGSGGSGSDSGPRAVSSSPQAPAASTTGTTASTGTTTDSSAASSATASAGQAAGGDTLTGSTSGNTTTTGTTDAAGAANGTTANGTTDTQGPSGSTAADATGTGGSTNATGSTGSSAGSGSSSAPLISATGVRGDVLMTMLDQVPCNQDPSETRAVDGPAYPRSQNEVSDTKAQFSLDPSTYKANPDFQWPPSGIFLSRPCNAFIYQPAEAGTYTLNVASYAFSRTRPVNLNKGFNNIALTPQLTVTASGASLSTEMPASARRDLNPYPESVQATLKPETEDATLKADSAFGFRLTDTVAFSNVLKQWHAGQNRVQLMLLPGQTDQAKLCWNIEMQFVKRLQCQVWQVPANWKRGQELKEIDQYIVDDRSVYPNESGMRYFRTAVQPQS